MITGRLIGHREGFGFVVPDKPLAETDRDIFIPAAAMKDAMHGDRVEVQVFRSRPNGGPPARLRLEGVILRVLERAQQTIVGEFHYGARANHVQAFDHRISGEIEIPRGEERTPETVAAGNPVNPNRQFGGESAGAARQHGSFQDLEGMMVDVEITRFPSRTAPARGRVIEIIGRREDFGVDVEIMIRKHHLPHRFPAAVLAEAEGAASDVSEPERAGRENFRGLPIVTIDGETAKDFDDAVYVERIPGGRYRLQVHIADVAHYVRPGSPLDREARLRGTSVYFPDRAVPMLPLKLSNGICSLNPHVDRLVMSAVMEIDKAGRLCEARLTPAVIHSAERMTYTAVQAVLEGDESARRRYSALVEEFLLMEELANVLNKRREARGSIDFDLPEAEIEFDERGQMTGVTRAERNMAHRIIEEFMLAANETIALYLEQRAIPALYRVHEKPDPKKVMEFEEIAARFGYSLGVELPAGRRVRLRARDDRERYPRFHEEALPDRLNITSRHYQRLTQRLAGKPEERILSYLMLRSLKQARYSEENTGHFALAAPTYTHFTSPIRRYPDLIVHRILKAALQQQGGAASFAPEAAAAGRSTAGTQRAPGSAAARKPTAGAGTGGGSFVDREELHTLGIETSESERRAADAERELMDWKKVVFMSNRLGDEFDALVIGLTARGFFVELIDLFIEGFVPVESFDDPYWIYREKLRALVHRDSGRSFRLGDRIRVRLDRIDRTGNKLLFSVPEKAKARRK
ncbi:MAG: ribonuclease R family protein [Terriglobia bacterium]